MPGEPRRMVLRALNMPPELDDQLRAVAFVLRRSKSDLIRLFVSDGLKSIKKTLKSGREEQIKDIVQSIFNGIDNNAASMAEPVQFLEDLQKMRRVIAGDPRLTKSRSKPRHFPRYRRGLDRPCGMSLRRPAPGFPACHHPQARRPGAVLIARTALSGAGQCRAASQQTLTPPPSAAWPRASRRCRASARGC